MALLFFFAVFFFQVNLHNYLLIFLVILLILHSLYFSELTLISFLKVLSFFLVYYSFHTIFTLKDNYLFDLIFRATVAVHIILCCLSLFFLFSYWGFLRNSTGFQGFMNHPQAFSIFTAFASFLFLILISYQQDSSNFKSLLYISFLLIFLFFTFITESRTSVFASLFSIGFFLIYRVRFSYKAFFFFIGLVFYNVLYPYVVSKSGRVDVSGLFDAYLISRSVLIDPMLININKSFMFGIGFGVPSLNTNLVDQFPPAFSVEKGNSWIALLEEVGIFLAIGIYILLIFRFRNFLPLFLLVVLINFGEAVFFSMGGIGLYCIYMLFLLDKFHKVYIR